MLMYAHADVLAAELCAPNFTGEVCEAAAAAAGSQWSHTEGSGAADQLLCAGSGQHCLCHGLIPGHQTGQLTYLLVTTLTGESVFWPYICS